MQSSMPSMASINISSEPSLSEPLLSYDRKQGSYIARKQSVLLEFENITATVKNKKLLHGVSGSFQPGTLTAIIGTSGAGKTTLLNILAGFHSNTPGMKVTGNVLLNGKPRRMKIFRKNSALIVQDDILTPSFTPQEALMFCAKLRLGGSERMKQHAVSSVIEQLGMKDSKDVVTGHPEGQKGLSGGQRKRLSIALEMITQPPVLFLDEPTSGLDSTTALQLGRLLKELASAGRTVICTIHQPSSALFYLFDQVIVMCAGEIAHAGPTKTVTNALSDVGIECPRFENPAEWILMMATDPQAGMFLVDQQQSKKKTLDILMPPELEDQTVRLPRIKKFGLLYKRCIVTTIRDRVLTRARAGAHIFMGLLIGLLYLNLGTDQATITDRMGMIFFSLIYLMLVSLMPTVLTFPTEKAVFKREYQNNWYSVGVYYLAKSFADVPFQIWFPFIFGTITFFMTDLFERTQDGWVEVYFKYQLVLVLQTLVAQSLGVLLGIATPTLQTAVFAAPMIATPNLLFCGFLVKTSHIWVGLRWLQYVCYIKFALQAAVLAIFEKAKFTCTPDQYIPGTGLCPVTSGQQIIDSYGYDSLGYWTCVGILAGYFALFRLLGYIILKRYALSIRSAR